jgi:predicted aspartyl protease
MDINIYFDGQLIYTSLKLVYKGKLKIVDKLVVDTGAAKTFISIEAVEDLNVSFEDGDYITTVYGVGGPDNSFQKLLDCVEFGSKRFENYKIDFGAFHGDYDINGLIGLDLLKDAGITIDLKNMRMTEPQ